MEDIDLNPTDNAILNMLREGRCTPSYIAKTHDYSRGNIKNRLDRLVEHEYVKRLDRGLYELVDDPRPDAPAVDVDLDALRADLRRAVERREWAAVEDAAARVGVDVDAE